MFKMLISSNMQIGKLEIASTFASNLLTAQRGKPLPLRKSRAKRGQSFEILQPVTASKSASICGRFSLHTEFTPSLWRWFEPSWNGSYRQPLSVEHATLLLCAPTIFKEAQFGRSKLGLDEHRHESDKHNHYSVRVRIPSR
jgi:hypothetical protein